MAEHIRRISDLAQFREAVCPGRSGSAGGWLSAGLPGAGEGLLVVQRFAAPGTARRTRPAETARILHRLITEFAALATVAAVTKRATKRRPPAGPQTSPLFDDGDLSEA